jgi:hypothetical protein
MARIPKTFKADTEQFVRAALSRGSDQKPTQQKIRKAVNEIMKAFEPIVAQKDSLRKR